jgi:hypothetical protein
MNKTLFLFFILFAGRQSYVSAQQFETPVDYHNYIVGEQEKVVNAVIGFSKHFDSKDSVLLDNYAKTKAILRKSWENVKMMPPYDSSTELRDAAIPLFEMYYNAMNIDYQEIVDLYIKKDFSKKSKDRVTLLINSINEREKKLDYLLVKAQSDFAAKYNLDVQKNPVQQKVNDLKK